MATTATQQRPKNRQQRPAPPPPPKETEQAVAVFQAPRLPFHPEIQKRFGVDRSQWRALTDAIFPLAKTADAILLALSYCKARKLDPFKRPVHIVPIYDSKLKREVESVWPGVGELRTTATRTGVYAGLDEPEFGEVKTHTFKARVKDYDSDNWKDEEATVTFPEWCRVTVYKMVQGQRVPFPGPRVIWSEFYTKKSRYSTLPNEMWAKKSSYMLEKCAEANALRRAFPDELGDQFSAEEAGFFGAYDARPVDAEVVSTTNGAAPATEPRRSDFEERPQDEQAASDDVAGNDGGEQDSRENAGNQGAPHETKAGGPAAAETQQDPAAPKASPWAVDASIVGQDNKIAAINKLLLTTKTPSDVDALESEHGPFIDKLGQQKKSEMKGRIKARHQELSEGRDE